MCRYTPLIIIVFILTFRVGSVVVLHDINLKRLRPRIWPSDQVPPPNV